MRYLIITGGSVDLTFAAGFLRKETFDRLIAVDSGLQAVYALGLLPDFILGDFDSVDSNLLKKYQDKHQAVFLSHSPHKDLTDTELAIHEAVDRNASEIVILGATGTRLDHTLGNIHCLNVALQAGIPCCLLDANNKIFLIKDHKAWKKSEVYGKYVSLIPLTAKATGVTLTGFGYPLTNAVLSYGVSLGISNEITKDCAFLTMESGILICIESKD